MQKILILGATSPIARALALKFAYDGARLYLAARDAGEAQRVAEDVGVRAGVAALSGTFDAVDFASHDEFYPSFSERTRWSRRRRRMLRHPWR